MLIGRKFRNCDAYVSSDVGVQDIDGLKVIGNNNEWSSSNRVGWDDDVQVLEMVWKLVV